MQPSKYIGYLELTFSTICLGITFVIAKYLVDTFPIISLLTIRFFIGGLVFLIIAVLGGKRITGDLSILTKRDWALLIGQAICSGGFNILLLYGMQYTSATVSGLLTSTTPAFTAILAWIVLRENISFTKWLAIILAIVGISILNTNGYLKHGDFGQAYGNVLIIGAVLIGALLTIFIKLLPNYVKPFTVAYMASVIPFIIYLPIIFIGNNLVFLETMPPFNWINLLLYALLANVLFPLFWNKGLIKVPANTASLFTGVIPVTTMLLAFFFLKEAVNHYQLLGLFIILFSIWLGVWKKNDYKS